MGNVLDLYSFDFHIKDFNLWLGSGRSQTSEVCHVDRRRLHLKAEAEFTKEGQVWVRMYHCRCPRDAALGETNTSGGRESLVDPVHTQVKNSSSDVANGTNDSKLYPSLLGASGKDIVNAEDSSGLTEASSWVKTHLRVKGSVVCQDCSGRDFEFGERELEITGESDSWRWLWDVTGGPVDSHLFRQSWLLNQQDRLLLRFSIVVWEDAAIPSTVTMVRNVFGFRSQRDQILEAVETPASVDTDIEWREEDEEEDVKDEDEEGNRGI